MASHLECFLRITTSMFSTTNSGLQIRPASVNNLSSFSLISRTIEISGLKSTVRLSFLSVVTRSSGSR